VRPFNEEFEAAQSQAGMSGGAGGGFDDLAKLQKDIIVATWRLDRRQATGAGKSAADLKSVAKSQAEVKAKATQMAARMAAPAAPVRTRPGRGQTPAPPPAAAPAPSGPGPMQRAVDAMGRAQAALEELDTRAAIPHENAALNELLKAEAEVRRRQVARQNQSGAGRGGQSGNQDLSALFDRELQRQQQTNYEQKASTESRDERPEDENLRRLRELAARQDQVNREQRELARRRDQVSAEEMKRRLERLTREQEELKRQAEELARRMEGARSEQQSGQRSAQGQQGQPGQQSPSGQQGGGQQQGSDGRSGDAQRLREAADEMARATSELQRESPSGASERSQRALERLRSAERGLKGEPPDERRRAAADVQSEARQLAEAERTLADQADAAAGAGDREAVERLARQQSGLAERAESLQRAASDLANREAKAARDSATGGGGTAGRTPDVTRRAARDLANERLAERMREGAAAARDASRTGNPSDAARQLATTGRAVARPLERLAEALGQASGVDAESRRLSDALGRARALRDQLAAADRAQQGQASRQGQPSHPSQSSQQSQSSSSQQGGTSPSRSASASGQPGSRGEGGQGSGSSGDAGRAQADFVRGLREQRELVDALRREDASFGRLMQSLEGWTPSTSAPGTEPWKQDRARWDELKKGVTAALERFESSTAARLAEREARQRLDAGADERPPDAWRQDVADYFRAIAKRPSQ
jgi:hypothetical protein